MFKRAMMLATLSLTAITLGACSESATAPIGGDPEIAALEIPEEGSIDLAVLDVPGADGSLFDELARQIPGFGGFWFDRRCNLNVVLTTPGETAEVAKEVLAPYLRRFVETHRCPDTATILVHPGDFDWISLSGWLRALSPAAGFRGVARIGISVPLNRIVVAVDGRQTAHEVLRLAAEVGVPAEAIKFTLAGTTDRQRDATDTRQRDRSRG